MVRDVGVGGLLGRCFRLYDNDGHERREGWGRVVTTEELAGSDCVMHAVEKVGSKVAARASVPQVMPRTSEAGDTVESGVDVG